MSLPAANAALRDKDLMYVCIRTAQEKIRTLYKYILPGRRCIIICHDDVRAEGLTAALNDLHAEAKKDQQLAMFVDGSTPVPLGLRILVVSASGAALTPEEAVGFDTFIMYDNPTSKEQYKNWVWHSHCPAVISFLVDDPEEQNVRENYLLDEVEVAFGVPPKELILDTGKRSSKKSGKERDSDRERDRSRQKHRDREALQRMEDRHREETEKLTQLLQSLLLHQQVQVQQYQVQQQEQRSELEQQIKQLQGLLDQQQRHMEEQRRAFEAKLTASGPGEGRTAGPDVRPPAMPLPTVQQYAAADPARQALLLQQLQYAQQVQLAQHAASHATPLYYRAGVAPVVPVGPPPPPVVPGGAPPAGRGRGGPGRPARGGKGQPRWATADVHGSNPFGQAPAAAAPSSVQQLAKVDQELQALRSQLAQRQGLSSAQAQGAEAEEEEPHGVWVPGKGYTGPRNQRPPPAHTLPRSNVEVTIIDEPAPEEWNTSERWDENSAAY